MQTAMAQALPQSTSHKNVRVVLDTPHVKSAETRKLFNAGVSGNLKTGKSADPTCYNALVQWRASCKHSASRFSSRTKHRASAAAGDGFTSRSVASGSASATTWGELLASRSINTTASSRVRRSHGKLTASRARGSSHEAGPYGTMTNCRRLRAAPWPMPHSIGRQAPCSIDGNAACVGTRLDLRLLRECEPQIRGVITLTAHSRRATLPPLAAQDYCATEGFDMAQRVNLDAMIRREDFAREIRDAPAPETIRELNLSQLLFIHHINISDFSNRFLWVTDGI